jgi:hypothetical protein
MQLTGLCDMALLLFSFDSRIVLFLFPNPANMSEKSPPKLKPRSLSSNLGGVAVLA